MSARRAWEIYRAANAYLEEGLIRSTLPDEPNPRTRREWMQDLLPELGHPERCFGAIHVAGTSGKGSVATMIATILREAGARAGLHVSPYLQVSTEKLAVDGEYASAEELAELAGWLRPVAEAHRGPHVPLHGLGQVAIALERFRRARVELAVIEAGVGGRHDVTNVLQTRVAAITSVGLDHLATLGPDLESIAWHKAGIIRPGGRAVVLEGAAVAAARRQAAEVGAPLRVLGRAAFRGREGPGGCTLLDYEGPRLRLEGCVLGLRGVFQVENAALALAAVEELALVEGPSLEVSAEAARRGLERSFIPGRLELLPASSARPAPVLLDGAHNPDKLSALLGSLPALRARRLHVVYGALASRAPDRELRRLAAGAETFVATEPRVVQKPPRPAGEIRAALAGAPARVIVEPDPGRALDLALDRARPEDLVLVTGSLYLVGELRGRFWPAEEVLARRSSRW